MLVATFPFSMRDLAALTSADGLAAISTSELISWYTALLGADNVMMTRDGGALGRDAITDLRAAVTAEINKRIPTRS